MLYPFRHEWTAQTRGGEIVSEQHADAFGLYTISVIRATRDETILKTHMKLFKSWLKVVQERTNLSNVPRMVHVFFEKDTGPFLIVLQEDGVQKEFVLVSFYPQLWESEESIIETIEMALPTIACYEYYSEYPVDTTTILQSLAGIQKQDICN